MVTEELEKLIGDIIPRAVSEGAMNIWTNWYVEAPTWVNYIWRGDIK